MPPLSGGGGIVRYAPGQNDIFYIEGICALISTGAFLNPESCEIRDVIVCRESKQAEWIFAALSVSAASGPTATLAG